ncbi:TniQ family protein [Paraglaciecola hydrolytica]|uniref:TniQ domain-containing protein n=1 Tax=Paraglaciecola hydrolytica TaxID=1799789 RepID=A0A148KL87_9ALTE|nr:TniQ family protein [Paraglaciecola hydrolytica]KXI27040.1 hypothetical protein AX660_02100 [Paraglaciecola hydrolytica]
MINDIPPPFENEHIHSVLARFNVLEGRVDFRKTLRELIPQDKELNNKFVWRTNFEGIWCRYQNILDRSLLLQQHTSFHFDACFLPTKTVEKIVAGPCTEKVGYSGIKNVFNSHVWRWCPDCVDENGIEFGMRFWHMLHQIPTIAHCPKHEIRLNYACPKCEFAQTKLVNYELPPAQNQCPKCHNPLPYCIEEIGEESAWLQTLTTELIERSPISKMTEIRTALKNVMLLPNLEDQLSKFDRKKLQSCQSLLLASVVSGDYREYFTLGDSDEKRVAIPYSLSPIYLIYREHIYPPLCYLALLRLFLKRSEVSSLLLGS